MDLFDYLSLSFLCSGPRSGRVDGIEVAEATLRDLLGEGSGWRAWLTIHTLGNLVCFLAAFTPLALVAGYAGLAAASVAAPALRVAVAAWVEVGAAHLLGEDVDHVLLFARVWTRGGQAFQEVASVVGLDLGFLGLCGKLLEESRVYLALEELVGAGGGRVLGRPSRLQFGPVITSLGLLLGLSCDEELARRDPLADAAHLASLLEDLEAWALSGLGDLPEDLLGVDWRLLGRGPLLCSPVEGAVGHVVLTSHAKDAAR